VLIQVYEGERPFARDKAMIGRFLLELPRGSESERGQEVVVIFSMDKKGNLSFQAQCAKHKEKFAVPGTKQRFSGERVNQLIDDARRNKAEDDKRLRPVLSRNQLENYAHWLMADMGSGLNKPAEAKKRLKDKAAATLEWLKANPDADMKDIEDKKSDLETAELATGKSFEETSENTSSNRNVKRLD